MAKLGQTTVSLIAVDANGDTVSGAKLYVYEAGTTTPVTTYSDAALSTANAFPVIANAAGKFNAVFVPDGNYKIDITDADGTSLPGYPEDNVNIPDQATSFREGFKTVTALLNDSTKLGYSGAVYTVAAGDIVNAGGFRYEVAASGASDEHVTTAGGVKLYVRTPDVRAFGAPTDGTGNVASAISEMADEFGFVHFGDGDYRVETATISVPLSFDPGAYLTVPASNTLTIKSRITSSRQWIFRGAGSYSLEQDSDIGEDSKQVHVSWFGAFPSPNDTTDQAPFIQAASDAMGNTREGVIQFDNGNYHISSAMTVKRGILIVGVGTRRTVFRADADGYDMFTTAGVAVRFENIQFEVQSPLTAFSGSYIVMDHNDCEANNIRCFGSDDGVQINADNCRVSHIGGTYGASPAAGSALVHLASGAGARVEDVYALTSAFGPDALVRVGGSGTVSNFIIDGVQGIVPSRAVWLDASAGNIVRGNVYGVVYNGFSGTPPDYQIDVVTSGTYSISQISIDNYQISAQAANGIRLLQGSSGSMSEISIGGGSISGTSGIGLRLERTAGTMSDIRVSEMFDALSRATPVSYSGAISDLHVSPAALPDSHVPITKEYSVPNDSVEVINLRRSVFTNYGILTVGNADYGHFLIRAVSGSEAIVAMVGPTANITATTGVLTGTTGVSGDFTISVSGTSIYLENRRGGTQAVCFTLGIGL